VTDPDELPGMLDRYRLQSIRRRGIAPPSSEPTEPRPVVAGTRRHGANRTTRDRSRGVLQDPTSGSNFRIQLQDPTSGSNFRIQLDPASTTPIRPLGPTPAVFDRLPPTLETASRSPSSSRRRTRRPSPDFVINLTRPFPSFATTGPPGASRSRGMSAEGSKRPGVGSRQESANRESHERSHQPDERGHAGR